jgi:hypothetical protein
MSPCRWIQLATFCYHHSVQRLSSFGPNGFNLCQGLSAFCTHAIPKYNVAVIKPGGLEKIKKHDEVHARQGQQEFTHLHEGNKKLRMV